MLPALPTIKLHGMECLFLVGALSAAKLSSIETGVIFNPALRARLSTFLAPILELTFQGASL